MFSLAVVRVTNFMVVIISSIFSKILPSKLLVHCHYFILQLSFVVQAVMAFASGTEACEGALSKLSGMVDDLNEAIKLSANKQLNPDMTHSSDNTKLSRLVLLVMDK